MLRAGKWLLRVVVLLVALGLLLFAVVALVLSTESGTRWALARISTAVPGNLVAENFSGTLWRGLHFPGLVYADDTQRIEAEELDFRIHWPSLAAGRVHIDTINAKTFSRYSYRFKGAELGRDQSYSRSDI